MMKAHTEQYQLRTTATGEPDREQRKRKKTRKSLTRETEELETTECSIAGAGRQGEMGVDREKIYTSLIACI